MNGSKIRTLEGAKRMIAILTKRCAEYDEALGAEKERHETEVADQKHAAVRLFDEILRLKAPVAARLPCPGCGNLHIDEGEFATKPHHTHACQFCGEVWRPLVINTVGVRFLPGFKNPEPETVEARTLKALMEGRVSIDDVRRIGGLMTVEAARKRGSDDHG